MDSIKAIREQFNKFSASSGLIANSKKCEVKFFGINDEEKEEIRSYLQMKSGVLPIKHLSALLASRKLKYIECKVLVVQICKPIITQSTSKFLSNGAKVCLIRSVLNGIKIYWGLTIYSPKEVGLGRWKAFVGPSNGQGQS